MALQGTITITGDSSIPHGHQTELSISVIDTDTNAAPVGDLTYSWSSDVGSFVGATDGTTATFLADIAGNDPETASISCEVTLTTMGDIPYPFISIFDKHDRTWYY